VFASGHSVALTLLGVVLVATSGCRSDVDLGALPEGSLFPSRLGPSDRIEWNGDAYYLHGANLPWRAWSSDFGSPDGASTPGAQLELDEAFARAASGGLRVVRWTMFSDPTYPLRLVEDSGGVPTGFEQGVLDDLDAAIAIAERYDVYLVLGVFDGPLLDPVLLGDATYRRGVATAVGGLARRAPSGRVLAWEISLEGRAVEHRAALLAEVALQVRAAGASYVSASVMTFDDAAPLCAAGADFVGFIEQGTPETTCAACNTSGELQARYGMACPLVVDVFFGNASGAMRAYYDRGYAGGFAWSLLPGRTSDATPIDLDQARMLAATATDLGPP
jgi:hypothetical protein